MERFHVLVVHLVVSTTEDNDPFTRGEGGDD